MALITSNCAASEGRLNIVKFLVEGAGANHSPVDRWGGTPLDDARRSNHTDTVTVSPCRTRGLSSINMALITSDDGTTRSPGVK